MGERRKSGGKEKCKLLNQERKDTARLKPQRPGEALRLLPEQLR